ncbi:MarR family transcriptional regulator [Bacillus aquiflavi]|uniref:MarR family transcriptional regulator n=1 Tax=Bacillus aquiflavi TaxID=2672567 RepID=A0A6B3W2M1_9BACI|nr:MarR family transcriptional regulator [Bacillus aquiflavi]MBA4537890.1 MarR family transcriptional regulator [Bacillus aquiflavi]NEY82146.1 MarR family transcriptional regulator [Bacillus aquiflavi]UAC48412.1 MarR family transcriptional regulator [Bacillus aquiflavi]
MIKYEDFLDFMLDNARKLFYPEEWINIDVSLSKTEIFCLLLMKRNNEVIMSEIAESLGIPMSTATGVINRLVKKGYLERYRSETDRRIVVIRLTEEGHKLGEKVKALASRYFNLMTEVLTKEETEALLQIFKKIVTHLGSKKTGETSKEQRSKTEIKNITID